MEAIQTVETDLSIGVDIGGTEAKGVIVVRQDGCLPRKIPESMVGIESHVKSGPRVVTGKVIPDAIQWMRAKANIDSSLIKGIGVDFPCPINAGDRRTLDVANMEHLEWKDFDAGTALDRSLLSIAGLNAKVSIENDGAATLFGLRSELPEPEQNKIIVGLFVGTGLGGGALVNGINHFNNASGGSEPGATKIVFDEGEILFGHSSGAEKRKLEEFVSIVAIERQLRLMQNAGIIPREHEILTLQATEEKSEWRVRAEKVLGYAVTAHSKDRTDDFSLRIFKLQQEVLGLYLQQLIQFCRPAHIFIGGGIVDERRVTPGFAQWYVDTIKQLAIENIVQENRREIGVPEFHIPKDGDFAAPIGAALMALQRL